MLVFSYFSHLIISLSLSPQKVSAFFCPSLSEEQREQNRTESQTHFLSFVPSVMEDDWDLHAVVRGCTMLTSSYSSTNTTTTTTTTTASSVSSSAFGTCYQQQPSSASSYSSSIFPAEQTSQVLSLSNPPFEAARGSSIEELHELCKPFFLKSHPPSSSFSYNISSAPKSPHTQQKQQHPNKQPHHAGSATTPRSKRRKNQLKKVCQVTAENLSSDIWAWRKYGQKPIKGSPYPRGYYRCSSSKGCLARKQVERNKSDPTMFIVTYTGEHSHPAPTHRNSLAGSTRQKPLTPQTVTDGDDSGNKSLTITKPVSPSTSGAEEVVAPLSAKSESIEDMDDLMNDDDDEEEENEFGSSDNMVVTDDFFEGLDELTGFATAATGDCFC